MNKNKFFSKLVVALCLALGIAVAQPTYAQVPTAADTTRLSNWISIVPLDCQDANGCDICEITKVFTNAASLIGSLLSGLALLMFVVGGLFLIFSAGNESRVETGKKILVGTVIGLAIIFLAWLGVNILVRMTSLSGGTGSNTIFSKNWWELEGCYPALFTTCKGHFIGEACGGGTGFECGAGTTNGALCQCYRYVDTTVSGNIKCEGDDKTSITEVEKGKTNTTNGCGCFTGCSILKGQTNENYTCTLKTTVDAANKLKAGAYSTRAEASCVKATDVCALLSD